MCFIAFGTLIFALLTPPISEFFILQVTFVIFGIYSLSHGLKSGLYILFVKTSKDERLPKQENLTNQGDNA